MADNKIVGYKNIFGFVLPDWVDEGTVRLLVTYLLLSAAMFFVLIFIIWPKTSTISELKSSLKTEEVALDSLKNSKMGYDQLGEQIPESTQNIILSAIPQSYSPENTVFLLRKIGSETPGLSIVSYKLPSGVLYEAAGTVATKTKTNNEDMVGYVSYPIRLTVTAPVGALLEFINRVETSLPFGVVSDLGMQEVSKLVQSTATGSVQMDLEIMYYQALLKQVDIGSIKPISGEDLDLVKKIAGFTRVSSMEEIGTGVVSVATGSSNGLFGF